jgi:hypothetical protein
VDVHKKGSLLKKEVALVVLQLEDVAADVAADVLLSHHVDAVQ